MKIKIALLSLVCFAVLAVESAAPTTKDKMKTEAMLLTNWGKFLNW